MRRHQGTTTTGHLRRNGAPSQARNSNEVPQTMHPALSELIDLMVDRAARNLQHEPREKENQCQLQQPTPGNQAEMDNERHPSKTSSAGAKPLPSGRA
jgi:hypothetical protein